ncbi:MAG: hypothetical protein ACOX05_03385 [Bacillota bacterium]|jgi:hypothetical protein
MKGFCNTGSKCRKPSSPPKGVKCLTQCVLDSCKQCIEVSTEIKLPIQQPSVRSSSLPPVGTCIPINPAGQINCQEISRECTCEGMCLSTVLFNYPMQLHNPCNPCDAMFYNITSMENVALCCTADSQLDCVNTRIISAKAVVTNVDCENITITIKLWVDTEYHQTAYQEICMPQAYVTEKRICDEGMSPCEFNQRRTR